MKIENNFVWYEEKNKDLDFSKIESISGWANLQGCSLEFKKSLAKTLKKCGDIYIEFIDEPLTLMEFKRRPYYHIMFVDEVDATNRGLYQDLTDNLTVNRAASSIDIVQCVKVLSTTKGLFVLKKH